MTGPANLRVPVCEGDLAAVRKCQKVLIVESWVHQLLNTTRLGDRRGEGVLVTEWSRISCKPGEPGP